MMNRFLRGVCAGLLGLAVSGCAQRVLVSEVLQQPLGSEIRIKCNLWYENPAEMTARNIQKGRILTAGSVVDAVRADDKTLVIRDKGGTIYTIHFDPGLQLCPMREYIRKILTLDSEEKIFEGISPETRSRIRRGEVVPGMTRREVLIAYGEPPPIRTPSLKNLTWIYYVGQQETVRVLFRGEKVIQIMNKE